MMKICKCLNPTFLILLMFALGACTVQPVQPRVQAYRTVFHALNTVDNSKLFILGYPAEINETLEFANYKKMFEREFLKLGYGLVDNQDASDNTVFISYGINDGKTSTQVGSIPMYGQTGGGYTTHSGSVYSGSSYGHYSGSSYTMPTFGVVGSSAYSFNKTSYTRNLAMDIIKTVSLNSSKPNKIFEGRIVSSGCAPQINAVMQALVDAMFKDFPGISGKSKKIVIPILVDPCAK